MTEQTEQVIENAVSTAAATKPATTAKASGKAGAKPSAAKKTSKAASKSKKAPKLTASESSFESEEFIEKMREIGKQNFKGLSKAQFAKLSDAKKVNCRAKRHYHKLKIDGNPDAWKRAVAAARKELGIAAK